MRFSIWRGSSVMEIQAGPGEELPEELPEIIPMRFDGEEVERMVIDTAQVRDDRLRVWLDRPVP